MSGVQTPTWSTPYDTRTDCPGCYQPILAGEEVCFHNDRVEKITSATPTMLWHVRCVRATELEDLL